MSHRSKICRNQSGQGLTEYLILLLLIAVGSIVAVRSLGGSVKDKIQGARERINSVSFAEE